MVLLVQRAKAVPVATRYLIRLLRQAAAGAIAGVLLLEDYQEDQEGGPSQVNLEAQETVLLFLRPKAMMVVLGVVQNQIEYLEAVGALTSRVIPMVLVTAEMELHQVLLGYLSLLVAVAVEAMTMILLLGLAQVEGGAVAMVVLEWLVLQDR